MNSNLEKELNVVGKNIELNDLEMNVVVVGYEQHPVQTSTS